MSHASVITALTPEQVEEHGGIEEAVEHQMKPFEEGSEWFADGSRWDWYIIGGRFTSKFAPGYDPAKDERNQETCGLCNGTGKRNDELGRMERKRNPNYGCNGCRGTGISVKFPSKWVQEGNICCRSDLNETKLLKAAKKKAEQTWTNFEKEEANIKHVVYGIEKETTKEQYVERHAKCPLTAYAFLKDRRWHEQGRLGWFNSEARTECEVKAEDEGREFTGRCLHTCKKTGAKIVSWQEANGADEDRWNRLFWARFIRNLPPDTVLVCVDYHV